MLIEIITAALVPALLTNHEYNLINRSRPAHRASVAGVDRKPERMNWKQTTATKEEYAIIRGEIAYRLRNGAGWLYWLGSCPAIRFTEEKELIDYVTRKHRAA